MNDVLDLIKLFKLNIISDIGIIHDDRHMTIKIFL